MKTIRALGGGATLVTALIWTTAAVAAWTECVILTTDYSTFGGVSIMQRQAPWAIEPDVEAVSGDAIARWHEGLVYVVNRGGASNIQILDPGAGYQTIRQFSIGVGRNPQDIAFSSTGAAYVSCYNVPLLLKVDVEEGTILEEISTAQFADADGVPETAWMQAIDDLLYIACQRLDRDNWYLPTGLSLLLVYNMVLDEWVDVNLGTPEVDGIVLTGENPSTQLELHQSRSLLRVGCSGWPAVLDGGVEVVDLETWTSLGFEVTEEELGGDLTDFESVNETLAFTIVYGSGFETSIRSYNPETGGSVAVIDQATGYDHADIAYERESQLFVADRALGVSGIRVFNVWSCEELTATPLPTGLPPFFIVLPLDEALTSVPDFEVADLQLDEPWPNPSNPSSHIRFRGPAGVPIQVGIYDLRGRRVRSAAVITNSDGTGLYFFNGRDEIGRLVASGVYRVVVSYGVWRETRSLTLVR
jgi:hypothetical protein